MDMDIIHLAPSLYRKKSGTPAEGGCGYPVEIGCNSPASPGTRSPGEKESGAAEEILGNRNLCEHHCGSSGLDISYYHIFVVIKIATKTRGHQEEKF